MEKMLDFLNGRVIQVNTEEGARKALHLLLRNNPDRVKHSEKVSELAVQIADEKYLSSEQKKKVLIAGLLHDIGYSEDFKFSNFHPVDGYYYLLANDWDKIYQHVALFHTFSRELAESAREDVLPTYSDKDLSEEEVEIIGIITEADFRVNNKGEVVSKEERLKDITDRHSENLLLTEHARMVYNKLK